MCKCVMMMMMIKKVEKGILPFLVIVMTGMITWKMMITTLILSMTMTMMNLTNTMFKDRPSFHDHCDDDNYVNDNDNDDSDDNNDDDDDDDDDELD